MTTFALYNLRNLATCRQNERVLARQDLTENSIVAVVHDGVSSDLGEVGTHKRQWLLLGNTLEGIDTIHRTLRI